MWQYNNILFMSGHCHCTRGAHSNHHILIVCSTKTCQIQMLVPGHNAITGLLQSTIETAQKPAFSLPQLEGNCLQIGHQTTQHEKKTENSRCHSLAHL
jgi:hypothetical protein